MVVFLSSAAVYGNAPADPQREDDAREPVSLYGVSKGQSEQLLVHYASHYGLRARSVRLFSVYGPGLRKQLLWDAMSKFRNGQTEFFGTGQERRDWVHVDDVCRFMLCLMKTPREHGFDIFNCGGQVASTLEVLARLADCVGAAPPLFNGKVRIGDPMCLVADCSKAARELNWKPEIDWTRGVAEYAEWYAGQIPNGNAADHVEVGADSVQRGI